MNTNQLGYDEVVDTFGDSVEIARALEEQLEDGLQVFPDALALYKQYPKVIEIYQDRGVFLAQLKDLTPEEAEQVWIELSERIGAPRSRVEDIALRSFSVASRTYRLIKHNLDEVAVIRMEVQEIVRGSGSAAA